MYGERRADDGLRQEVRKRYVGGIERAGVEGRNPREGLVDEVATAEGSGARGKAKVLFLCTHNSARSQIHEGLLRHLGGDRFEVYSAGTEATRVRPEAISVMSELGVDISGQESKMLGCYLDEPFEYVVTVCDDANEACPVFPGATERLHWSFEDPSRVEGKKRLAVFRRVRDEIRAQVEEELVNEEVET